MEQDKKSASALRQTLTFLMVIVPMLGITALFGSHISFQTRIVGVMQYSAAQEAGLLPKDSGSDAFGPTRVWFAKASDGRFEYRSAWPLVGSLPFDMLGSGKTDTDLLAVCEQLGENACSHI